MAAPAYLFHKEFLLKNRIQLGFLQKFDKLGFRGKLRRRACAQGHVSEETIFCKKKMLFLEEERHMKIHQQKRRLGMI